MTTQPMSELVAGIVPPDFKPVPVDYEAASLSYLAEARKRDAIARYDASVPPGMRETDWAHPAMLPNAQQIARVLAHQAGAKGLILTGRTGRGCWITEARW